MKLENEKKRRRVQNKKKNLSREERAVLLQKGPKEGKGEVGVSVSDPRGDFFPREKDIDLSEIRAYLLRPEML